MTNIEQRDGIIAAGGNVIPMQRLLSLYILMQNRSRKTVISRVTRNTDNLKERLKELIPIDAGHNRRSESFSHSYGHLKVLTGQVVLTELSLSGVPPCLTLSKKRWPVKCYEPQPVSGNILAPYNC